MTVFAPTVESEIEAVKARVRDLEQSAKNSPDEYEFEVSGACPGVPAAGAVTNPWSTRSIANLVHVFVDLDTASSSDSVWDVRKNGSSIATVTVASGKSFGAVDAAVTFLAGDKVDMVATTPGTGWARATVRAVFRTTRTRIESVTLAFPQPGGAPVTFGFAMRDTVSPTDIVASGTTAGDTHSIPVKFTNDVTNQGGDFTYTAGTTNGYVCNFTGFVAFHVHAPFKTGTPTDSIRLAIEVFINNSTFVDHSDVILPYDDPTLGEPYQNSYGDPHVQGIVAVTSGDFLNAVAIAYWAGAAPAATLSASGDGSFCVQRLS